MPQAVTFIYLESSNLRSIPYDYGRARRTFSGKTHWEPPALTRLMNYHSIYPELNT